jgi:uncharacterized protein
MFKYIFTFIATIVLIGMNVYIYKRFLCKVDFLKHYKKKIKLLVIIFVILEFVFFVTLRFSFFSSFWYSIFSSLIGISFMLFCIALVYDFLHLPLQKLPFDASRRTALKIILDISMFIIAFGYILKGFINGFKEPKLTELEVKIKNLKAPLEVVQISDVHIGQSLGKDFFDTLVQRINNLQADIVVITGDLVDLHVSKIGNKLDSLKDIHSKYGVYFVTGNHEYFHGVEEICKYLESLHVKVLDNENVVIDGKVNLVGVNDLMGRRMKIMPPNLKKAMTHVRKDLPTILLAHQPKFINEIKNYPINLVLSGHTHAGQIFPFGLLVLLDQPYLYGLHKHSKDTQVYVSSGAGYWGPPVRVMASSEIVKFHLQPDVLS